MLFEPFYEPSLRLISMKLRLWRLHPYYTEKGTFVKSLSAFFLHLFSLSSSLYPSSIVHSRQSTIAQLADAYLGNTQHLSHLADSITAA